MRVVASLTTMPDKWEKLTKTLETIKNQTYPLDAIYLSLPHKSRRLGIEYPEPDDYIKSMATIVRVKDYGPITKIAGGLYSENDPDTVIITFDDDMIYPNNIVEELLKCHLIRPQAAVGSAGMLLRRPCPMCAITPNQKNAPFNIPKFKVPIEGRKVDSVYGYPGALYVRKFFPAYDKLEEDFFSLALVDKDMFINDDIVISGYLSANNIDRYIFPNIPEVGFVIDQEGVRQRVDSEISYNLDLFFQRMNRSIHKAKQLGMYRDTEPILFSETVLGIFLISLFSILLLIALLIIFFFYF